MKRLPQLPLLLVAVLAACSDLTAPQADAMIVFRVEASCHTATFNLMIDGQSVLSREMAPLDSAVFPVAPGQHTASAVVVQGFTFNFWVPTKPINLGPNDRFVARLNCA